MHGVILIINYEKINDVLVKKTREISGKIGESIGNLEKLTNIKSKLTQNIKLSKTGIFTDDTYNKIEETVKNEAITVVEAEKNINVNKINEYFNLKNKDKKPFFFCKEKLNYPIN